MDHQKTKIRWVATSLVLGMAVGFVIAKYFEIHTPAPHWGYLRAFCEAGLVGALADWFAVVALFRHPLGQKWIPHTAIIPKNKPKIAKSVSQFFHQNFFDPAQVTEHLRKYALVDRFCEVLNRPQTLETISKNIQKGLPDFIRLVDDSDLKHFLKTQSTSLLSKLPLAPLTSQLLSTLSETGQHHKAFNQILRFTGTMLESNLNFVEERLALELRKMPSAFGLKDVVIKLIARKLVANVQMSLEAVIEDTKHPVREKFHLKTLELIDQLNRDASLANKMESLKLEFLQSGSLAESFDSMWNKLKEYVLSDQFIQSPKFHAQLETGLAEFVKNLQSDTNFKSKLENWLEVGVSKLIKNYGHELERMIHDTVMKWDEEEIATKLEGQVGDDLQYIRINGSLVGGTVGVILHLLTKLLGW